MPASAPCVLIAHPSPDLYGSDRVVLESVLGYREAGWRVVVCVPSDGPLVAELARAGAEVLFVPTIVLRKSRLRPRGLLSALRDLPGAVSATFTVLRRVRPDLVYVNTVTIPLWCVLAFVARRPALVHVHEAEEDVGRALRFVLASPLLLCRAVVVNSRATAQVLRASVPGLARRVTVVYNGVPGPADPSPPRLDVDGPLRLVLVGRLSPRKGTDLAVSAVALLRERGVAATLDLVGSVFPGYEWYEDDLRRQVAAAGLTDSVTFSGFSDSVWAALAAADVALVPSRIEPFGNTAVEAQLANRPVVVAAVQGLPETVEDGRWGTIVAPDDPQALADALVAIKSSWPATTTAAARARDSALVRFAPARYRTDIATAGRAVVRQV